MTLPSSRVHTLAMISVLTITLHRFRKQLVQPLRPLLTRAMLTSAAHTQSARKVLRQPCSTFRRLRSPNSRTVLRHTPTAMCSPSSSLLLSAASLPSCNHPKVLPRIFFAFPEIVATHSFRGYNGATTVQPSRAPIMPRIWAHLGARSYLSRRIRHVYAGLLDFI